MGRDSSRSPTRQHKEHKEKKRKDKDRDRDKDRDKDKDRERERDKAKSKDKDRDKDRERERSRDRDRHHVRHDDRDRDYKGRSGGSHKDSRSYRKEGRRSRSRSPSHSRSRSRTRSPKRQRSHLSPQRGGSIKLTDRPRSAGGAAPSTGPELPAQPAPAAAPPPVELSAEEAAKHAREAEVAELDAEVERRRRRVEEWRAKRQAEQQAADQESQGLQGAGAAAGPDGAVAVDVGLEGEDAGKQRNGLQAGDQLQTGGADGEEEGMDGQEGEDESDLDDLDEDGEGGHERRRGRLQAGHARRKKVGWFLEDDDGAAARAAAGQPSNGEQGEGPAAMDLDGPAVKAEIDTEMLGGEAGGEEEEEEEDPLEAFMRGNLATMATQTARPSRQSGPAPVAVKEEPQEEEQLDPLDAFMATTVMPKVSASGAAVSGGEASGRSAEAGAEQPAEGAVSTRSGGGSASVKREDAGVSIKQEDTGAKATASSGFAGRSVLASRPIVTVGTRPMSALLTGKPGLHAPARRPVARRRARGGSSDSDSDSVDEAEASSEEDDALWAQRVNQGKLSKGDKLGAVDHSQIEYPPFRKAFYTEVPELAKMGEKEVTAMRKELDGIKVRGNNVPKPIKAWTQAGLSSKIIDVLRKAGCATPLAIQAQAMPIIMSGRDCIGIAKTGSGKTLAFVLPLMRHIKDQPPLATGDGPIGLIMAPTRELVQQISKEVKKFAKPLGLECTAVFGGTGISNQISELKRGSEVVVCTPGRMIDLLVTSNGKITNLRRVTYLVMDEADRMFDMGFEPQIMRMINNVRPDRQTVLFSATFPRSVETLARKVLHDPCEIQVGGRSVVNLDITQIMEIRPEADRFLRLLEILGEWYERGKLIIFVQSQDKCDTLFRDLLKSGYPCLSLHGGKDQSDRESTITDFKGAVCNILVATSIAARGLDVANLVLVVNYDCPNHHEDYIHRVGRTGRAGQKGTAITFIAPDEDKFAPDLVKALKESNAPVPQDLQDLADGFAAKRKAGLVAAHGSGFGGSGFKFSSEEEDKIKATRKAAAKEYGVEVGDESDTSDDDIRVAMGPSGAGGGAAGAGGEGGNLDTIAAAASAAAQAVARQQQQALAQAMGQIGAGQGAASGAQQQQSNVQAAVNAAVSAMQAASGPGQANTVAQNTLLQDTIARIQAGQAGAGAGMSYAMGPPPPQQPTVSATVLAAQAAAARLAAGLPSGTGMGGGMQSSGTSGFNSAMAAVLAAIPGVQVAGQAAPQPVAAPSAPAHANATTAALAKEAAARAAMIAAAFGTRTGAAQVAAAGGASSMLPAAAAGAAGMERHYVAELEINDFPQHSRWKVTHRDTVAMIAETTGAALITKGVYVPPGKQAPEGERKIFLLIEGPTENSVKRAKQELKRILEETTEKVMRRDAPAGPGRYSVV